ncbi:MAG TPA: hypothetical protein P5567_14245 [Kiritimatiellia bacterium]|nr:hypothetical protein [Kiritimatiellia bacterium]HRZ13603.1 hypothetical protein [Kiritimatiellia bacterium]HSA19301.1 hypothetical protein [Kiritimatiellia bacterium]
MKRITYTIGLISALQVGLEILFIKLARYDFGTFSIAVVGVAMLGIGAAGLLVHVWSARRAAVLERSLLALPVLILLSGIVFFSSPQSLGRLGAVFTRLGLEAAAVFLVMGCSAIPVFALMEEQSQRVSLLYGASLLGAALGAVASFVLSHVWGDIVAYAAMSALLAFLWLPPSCAGRVAGLIRGVGVLTAVAGFVLYPFLERRAHPDNLYSRSNSFTRIDVIRDSDTLLHIKTGGVNAGTSVLLDGYAPLARRFRRDASAIPFYLGLKRALILGSGGGKNVCQALAFGVDQVTAVEINGLITDFMEGALPEHVNPYRDPKTRLIVGEGRAAVSTLRKAGTRFDLVYVTLATVFGSSGHVFTHTYLMTRDAVRDYLGLVDEGGIVAAYHLGGERLRAKIARAFFDALLAVEPGAAPEQVAVFAQDAESPMSRFVVMARKGRPFTAAEAEQIKEQVREVEQMQSAREIEAGRSLILLTDNNPFLHNDTEVPLTSRRFFVWNHRMLNPLLGATAVLCLALCLRGAWRKGKGAGLPFADGLSCLAAFSGIGFAYTLQQTLVLQKLEFFLEHPVTNTFVVLPLSLVGTGLGSMATGVFVRRLSRTGLLLLRLILPSVVVGLAAVPSAWLLGFAWPLPVRIVASAFLVLPCFFLMGTYFPVFFARTARLEPALLPWCWAVNATAAVVGSLFFIVVGMQVGFRALALVPAAVYLLVSLWDWRREQGGAGEGSGTALTSSGAGAFRMLVLAGLGVLAILFLLWLVVTRLNILSMHP